MSRFDETPGFDVSEEDGVLFLRATWVTFTAGEVIESVWRSDSKPRRSARDACLIAAACHQRSHPGASSSFLDQEVEVAVKRLEAGAESVPVFDAIHRISRGLYTVHLDLETLFTFGDPLEWATS